MTNSQSQLRKIYQERQRAALWEYYRCYLKEYAQKLFVLGSAEGLLSAWITIQRITRQVTIKGDHLPSAVAWNFINPFVPSTQKVTLGTALAKYDPDISPALRIPKSLYDDCVNSLLNGQASAISAQGKALFWFFFLMTTFCLGKNIYQKYRKEQQDSGFIRGSRLLPTKEVALSTRKKKAIMHIGPVRIPTDLESRHILVYGASGSGKSTLLAQMLHSINNYVNKTKESRPYILVDVKPEFIGKFYKEGDIVFCPFDKRGVAWNPFNDITDMTDYDSFARSLFAFKGKDPFWEEAAARILSDILRTLHLQGKATVKDLRSTINMDVDDLKDILDRLPTEFFKSSRLLNSPDSTILSILATLNVNTAVFDYLKSDSNDSFSFRKYIKGEYRCSDGTIPNLYILSPADKSELMTPLITLATNIMMTATLSLPPDPKRRIYFFLDELGNMNKIQMLPDLITKGRSYGASIIAMSQDNGRIKEKYGPEVTQSMTNNFSTFLSLRINEAASAADIAKNFGEGEFRETHVSSQTTKNQGPTITYSQERKTYPVVTASELLNQLQFHGFLKMTEYGICRVTVPNVHYPDQYPNFDPLPAKTIVDLMTPPAIKKDVFIAHFRKDKKEE